MLGERQALKIRMEDKHGRQALLVGRLNKKTNFIDWILSFESEEGELKFRLAVSQGS